MACWFMGVSKSVCEDALPGAPETMRSLLEIVIEGGGWSCYQLVLIARTPLVFSERHRRIRAALETGGPFSRHVRRQRDPALEL